MRRTKGCAYICTMAIMGTSLMMGTTAMAQDDDIIAIPYQQEDAWSEIAMTNDDMVSTGINIRSTASEDSQVIGCLYHGGAAWVINKGEEWTEVYSGGLTGFVKNEYLVFGEDAKGLAQSYGTEGVATTWDDVKLYAAEDGGSDVLNTLDTGSSFILTQDNGHWLQVQHGADSTAYVSSEDVSRVLLLDTAVPSENIYGSSEAYEETYTDSSYTETYETEAWVDDTSYTETYETEAWVDDTSYTETYETEAWVDDTSYTETYETEAWVDDTSYTETYETEAVYDSVGEGYYDADTDTYYDEYGNVVAGGQADEAYTEVPQTEAPQTEAPQTEAPQTEAPVSSGSDDTSLLAALIYCEAGNQSYEGMVAVGAVVMNRVYSPSFPNSISDVIYQSGQFTPAYSGSLASALANGVPSTCYDAAAAAIAGENPVGGALYFNTGSGKGTKIGDHQFY